MLLSGMCILWCVCGIFCRYLGSPNGIGCQLILMLFYFLSRWRVYWRKWVLNSPTINGLMSICVFKLSHTFPPWNWVLRVLCIYVEDSNVFLVKCPSSSLLVHPRGLNRSNDMDPFFPAGGPVSSRIVGSSPNLQVVWVFKGKNSNCVM